MDKNIKPSREKVINPTSSPSEKDIQIQNIYLQRLADKLKETQFRNIDGFPVGTDEAIIALSDPPYFTACPNPFIEEWLQQNIKPYNPEQDNYHREPFATDVSEGKTDPIYNAHSYHTKIPYKAIMRYILHYTEPDDIVYDGFCGTGMTGVAAQLCGNKKYVASLGYNVNDDGTINNHKKSFSKLGTRKAILSDLSPLAGFIAYNYNNPIDIDKFQEAAKYFFEKIEHELSWFYQTKHIDGNIARINYVVWSEVFNCPNCGNEVIFLEEALNQKTGQVSQEFNCPNCRANISKRLMSRVFETYYDRLNNMTAKRVKRVPVLINYRIGNKKYNKKPDEQDLILLQKIEETSIDYFFPSLEMPYMYVTHVKDKMSNFGISHFSHFFLPRQQHALAIIWKIANDWPERHSKNALLFMIEQCIWGMTILNRYSPTHYSQVNRYMSGVFYVPSQISETSPWYVLEGKYKRLIKVFASLPKEKKIYISVNSGSDVSIADNSIDYIFTDPPFGENLQYSELNWFNESFYKIYPNKIPEAVVNKAQGKETEQYMTLMLKCFQENFRILKSGRWMTVVFHNSQNSIWNAIHEAIVHAGFIVADVRTLDKQGQTYKQALQGTVKSDLVISCYKPKNDFEKLFQQNKGKPQGVIQFIRQHLDMLPVVTFTKENKIETIAERTRFLLFDRMVAYHLQKGANVPMSASEFYQMLNEQCIERDEMYFLHEQVVRYDATRVSSEVEQLDIFIRDERSAVQWVRGELTQKPQTLGELTPKYLQETRDWDECEPRIELRDLLKENFIVDENGYWRVPDPNREKDLEALRRKVQLKTFEGYVTTKGPLKVFRKEAVLEGFKHCWQTKQYAVIVGVCEKIPPRILQEIHEFIQFYDIVKELVPDVPAQLQFTWEA